MNLKDVRVLTQPLVLASTEQVDEFERERWLSFPRGYRDYVTRLGEGTLSSFVRIYPPWRIEKELTDWRSRINKYWFWDKGRDLLPKERALECIILGDTVVGDELVFHPVRPNRLFVLPRGHEIIFEAGSDLLSAIEWIGSSKKLVEPFNAWEFEPFDSRLSESNKSRNKVADPEGESLDDIMELCKRWSKRHMTARISKADLREVLEEPWETKLVYKGIMIETDWPYFDGYVCGWRLFDKKSKLDIGMAHWHMADGGHGTSVTYNQDNLRKLKKRGSK